MNAISVVRALRAAVEHQGFAAESKGKPYPMTDRAMRVIVAIAMALTFLTGCASSHKPVPGAPRSLRENDIYAALRTEPIPLPDETPYDDDERQRTLFGDGFRSGWDWAISGALLHGTSAGPAGLTPDMMNAWWAGWDRGTTRGSERWLKESQKCGK